MVLRASTWCTPGLFLVFFLHAAPCSAKLERGTVAIGSGQWHYVSKFGFDVGAGSYEVRLKLLGEASVVPVTLEVFLDEDWERIESLPPCARAHGGPARKTHMLRAMSEWSPWMGGLLEQNVRPHIWYFAFSKCTGTQSHYRRHSRNSAREENRTDTNATSTTPSFLLEYEFRARQQDQSELSVEMRYMPLATMLSFLFASGFILRFAHYWQSVRRSSGYIHPVVQTVGVSVLLQWGSQAFHLWHLAAFETDGVGRPTMDALGDFFFMLSQAVACTVLLMISSGFSLDQTKELGLSSSNRSLAVFVTLLHAALVGGGTLQNDHARRHHKIEGWVGWGLCLARTALFLWFSANVSSLQQTVGARLNKFLKHFHAVGSLYFLSFPGIYCLTQLFAPYLRHPVLHIGLALAQTLASFWLSDLILSRGEYYEVSTLSGSFLPGTGGGSLSPKRE